MVGSGYRLPGFREISDDRFSTWHPKYCNRIGWFVLPLMTAQLLGSASSCFFLGDDLSWARMLCVLFAWAVTFLISAPCHRRMIREGRVERVVERLIRTNLWRSLAWSGALLCSWFQY